MNLKLWACLACSAVLLLGACSGNNSSGASNAGAGTNGDGNGDSNGDSNGDGDTEPTADSATELRQRAVAAVGLATTAVESGDAARARQLIQDARTALTNAVNAANAEFRAATGRSAAEFGRASRVRDETTTIVAQQRAILEGLEGRLSWFGKNLVREAIARGSIANPGDSANTAGIVRIPRTRDVNGDGSQQANPDAFKSDTFKDVMYAADKEVFSNSGDEFKVGGYVMLRGSADALDETIQTGVKLTNDGLVIRTGSTAPNDNHALNAYRGDFNDMRKDITTWVSDSNNDGYVTAADGIPGQNTWHLAITFDEPKTVPVSLGFTDISDPVSNWRGNNAFYWRSLVPADDSQKSGGANYQADAFINQPAGQENLGTYEVWLSNNVGVNRKNEPAVPGTTVTCPDLSRGTRCPDDDVHRYLNYAAYGLFVYTADTDTFLHSDTYNGQSGRINTLHFGYSAFADATGQKITDIGEALEGTFTGYTLAYEVSGAHDDLPIKHKLLRGDVSLTVSIPKGSGEGKLYGTMNNFQRWDEENSYWTAYTENFAVALSSSTNRATIEPNGTFSGTTSATPTTGLDDSGAGVYKGSFYGPRANKNDLEVAGSWTIGSGSADNSSLRDLYGSFGAKQNVASTP